MEYELIATGRKYNLPEHACVFCKNCSDVWYDSGGIYKIWCDKENHCSDFGNVPCICKQFESEEE